MIYTLFVWTVVAASAGWQEMPRTYKDWRPIAEVQYYYGETVPQLIAKCDEVARQLNIPKDRYRCVRTK